MWAVHRLLKRKIENISFTYQYHRPSPPFVAVATTTIFIVDCPSAYTYLRRKRDHIIDLLLCSEDMQSKSHFVVAIVAIQ